MKCGLMPRHFERFSISRQTSPAKAAAVTASGACTGFNRAFTGRAEALAAKQMQLANKTTVSVSAHGFLQIAINGIEEALCAEPLLVRSDEDSQILGHLAAFNRVNAHLLQRIGKC